MPIHKVLLAILTMTIFGFNAIANKFGLAEFPPLFFTFLRFVLIMPGVLFIARPSISLKMLLAITLNLSIGFLLFANLGLALGASAGTYVFIQQTGSIFAIICTYFILGQKPSRFDLTGIGLGLIGIYWITSANGSEGTLLAILFLVASAFTWGLGFTLVKKTNAPSIPTVVWSSLFVIPILGFASFQIEGHERIIESVKNASLLAWSTVVFSSWISMLGAGGILMYLMRTEQVSKVVPYNMLVPLTGVLFASHILGEQLAVDTLIGGAWILLGLFLTQLGPRVYEMIKLNLVNGLKALTN